MTPLRHVTVLLLLSLTAPASNARVADGVSMVLFGDSTTSWQPTAWILAGDNKSNGHLEFNEFAQMQFSGSLEIDAASAANEPRAHVAAVLQRPSRLIGTSKWDFSVWDKLVVSVAEGDGWSYSINLHTRDYPTIKFRGKFTTKRNGPSIHAFHFKDLIPTFRGKPMDKSVYTLTPANLDTISFVASSMFGQQLGTFRVTLDSVSLARSDRLALFGAGASWRPGSWRVVDDRVQVGRSVGEIGFVEKGRVLKFTGVLKFRENDGNPSEKRAYASIVSDRRLSPQKSASAPLWNLSAYSQITVSIAKGDGKWYSLNLLTTTDPTTQHRFHFQTKDGSASTHTVQFSDLVPTRQGKRVSNVHSFDPTTVAAISLKCSSLFGKHNGAFALLVSGIIVGIDLDLSEMDSLAWVHNEL